MIQNDYFCCFLLFVATFQQLQETRKQLEAAQREAQKFKSQLTSLANILGDYIKRQIELFSVLFLEPNAEYQKILEVKKVLDLLFHADKSFVYENFSKFVKQKLNSTYAILCSKIYRPYYYESLTTNNFESSKKYSYVALCHKRNKKANG